MRAFVLITTLAALAWGCSPARGPAPVEDRRATRVATPAAKPPAPKAPTTGGAPVATADASYTVKRGDTLYSIALEHGADYREARAVELARRSVQAERRPGAARHGAGPAGGAGRHRAGGRRERSNRARSIPRPQQQTETRQKPAPREEPRLLEAQPLQFAWPAKGKVLAGFAEPRRKGIDIDGKLGDPVIAAAAGRVTYVGSGIPGLGKLVVIRHDQGYLTVYAHNKDILVKEQQSVTRGQKIAELGASDAERPKLHFQIRKGAAAVDPLLYLPKS